MNDYQQNCSVRIPHITNRQLVHGLQKMLDERYSRLLNMARTAWECRFSRQDVSDACVSVRISERSSTPAVR